MLNNFWFLFIAIAKASILTGLGPGLAIAVFLERRGFRVVAIGMEKVSAGEQLASTENRFDASVFDRATSSPRNVWKVAA